MDFILDLVRKNADISEDQALKAIEAVLAYVNNANPALAGQMDIYIRNNNGSTVGGLGPDEILEQYWTLFGPILRP